MPELIFATVVFVILVLGVTLFFRTLRIEDRRERRRDKEGDK
jgi:hypothetical protein